MEIRLGTIGSNFIVHNILRHVVKTPGWVYTAAYSRSEEKAEALANQYGAPRFYTDMDAFLSDEEMNFVYIATPNALHYEHAKAALLAGKHVLLEKPFCPEVSLAEELKQMAWQRGLILMDMTPTAFLPNLPVLKEQLGAAQEKTDEPVDENDPMAKLLKEFESYLGDKVMDMAGDIAKDVIKDTIGMATSGNDD